MERIDDMGLMIYSVRVTVVLGVSQPHVTS